MRVRGPAPLTVSFHVAASGGSDSYPLEDIYFGDGTAAVALNGASNHTYRTSGVYGASAYVADSAGNVSVSEPFPIVGGGSVLTVNLTASNATPRVETPVQLNATVHGGTAPVLVPVHVRDGSTSTGVPRIRRRTSTRRREDSARTWSCGIPQRRRTAGRAPAWWSRSAAGPPRRA